GDGADAERDDDVSPALLLGLAWYVHSQRLLSIQPIRRSGGSGDLHPMYGSTRSADSRGSRSDHLAAACRGRAAGRAGASRLCAGTAITFTAVRSSRLPAVRRRAQPLADGALERGQALVERVDRVQIRPVRPRFDGRRLRQLDEARGAEPVPFACQAQLLLAQLAVAGLEAHRFGRGLERLERGLDLGPDPQLLGPTPMPRILAGHPRGLDLPLAGEAREDRDRDPELGAERLLREGEREHVVLPDDRRLVVRGEAILGVTVHEREGRVQPCADLVRVHAVTPGRGDLVTRLRDQELRVAGLTGIAGNPRRQLDGRQILAARGADHGLGRLLRRPGGPELGVALHRPRHEVLEPPPGLEDVEGGGQDDVAFVLDAEGLEEPELLGIELVARLEQGDPGLAVLDLRLQGLAG